jgi:hypothetical protein
MRGGVLVLLSLAAPTTTHAQPLTTAKHGEVHHRAPVVITKTAPLPNAETIIRNFIAAETQFRETLLQFSFKRDVVLQTIGPRGEITGEYIRQSGFVLDDLGQRIERVVYHPASTIKLLKITKEDVQDLSGSQLFGLEPAEMAAYNFSYLGDELFKQRTVHLIAVSPKQEPNPQRMRSRFFVGRIWIDAASFQIVKLQGTTEPHGKQRFPAFETERGLEIEDRLFPSTTSADDVLRFPKLDVHYRIAVRYYDFKRFAGRLKIVEISGSE